MAGIEIEEKEAENKPKAAIPWPKDLPSQIAAVRDLISSDPTGNLDPRPHRQILQRRQTDASPIRPRLPRRPRPDRDLRRRERARMAGERLVTSPQNRQQVAQREHGPPKSSLSLRPLPASLRKRALPEAPRLPRSTAHPLRARYRHGDRSWQRSPAVAKSSL
jgi:hypothetical protein